MPPDPWVEVELPPEPEPVVEPEPIIEPEPVIEPLPEPEPELPSELPPEPKLTVTEELVEEPVQEEEKSKVGLIMGIIVAALFLPLIIYCIVQECKKCSNPNARA